MPAWLVALCIGLAGGWEYYMGKTDRFKSNSTVDMIYSIIKAIAKKGGNGLAVMFLISCSLIGWKYADDSGLLSGIDAHAAEAYIEVDGRPCFDLYNRVGSCAYAGVEGQVVKIEIPPMPYDYNLSLRCSASEARSFKQEDGKTLLIKHKLKDNTGNGLSACRVEIAKDRVPKTFAAILFNIKEPSYEPLEEVRISRDGRLLLGNNAKYTRVCYGVKCKNYKRRSKIKLKDSKARLSVFVESEIGRRSYYGIY